MKSSASLHKTFSDCDFDTQRTELGIYEFYSHLRVWREVPGPNAVSADGDPLDVLHARDELLVLALAARAAAPAARRQHQSAARRQAVRRVAQLLRSERETLGKYITD